MDGVGVHVPARVVSVDVVSVFTFNTDVPHLVVVSLIDDFAVDEEVWIDFVDWWQDHTFEVITMENGYVDGVDEHAFIDVLAGPAGYLVEGVPVLGVVKNL